MSFINLQLCMEEMRKVQNVVLYDQTHGFADESILK